MSLSIRNSRAEELARRAGRATGKTMTDVIVEALKEKLTRIDESRQRDDAGEHHGDLRALRVVADHRRPCRGRHPPLRRSGDA
ncbi:MAG: type II toxin-antitoxin system VapB family antitoxin [Spirochaetota bacterium]